MKAINTTGVKIQDTVWKRWVLRLGNILQAVVIRFGNKKLVFYKITVVATGILAVNGLLSEVYMRLQMAF